MTTLVVRFSSFGDIVLTGAVTGGLAPIRFLTLRAYADLARSLPGVVEVAVWEDRPSLRGVDRVVDLHASPRSLWASFRAGAPIDRVERFDLRRRLRVALKTAPPPSVVERYASAARVPPAPKPWLEVAGPRDALLLCPGAQHATKRWPAEHFQALGRRWQGPVVVLGGPGEEALAQSIGTGIGSAAEVVVGAPFSDVLRTLGRARVAVAGDTGLLHLCGAAAIPVVGLFGPTTPADGFWCHDGLTLGVELPCRPCSRHGSDRCPMGDHLCLRALEVDRVLTAATRLAADARTASA